MPDARILQGWKEIEAFAGNKRPALLRKGYPIQKESGGGVWAFPEDIANYRDLISEQKRTKANKSVQQGQAPLK